MVKILLLILLQVAHDLLQTSNLYRVCIQKLTLPCTRKTGPFRSHVAWLDCDCSLNIRYSNNIDGNSTAIILSINFRQIVHTERHASKRKYR